MTRAAANRVGDEPAEEPATAPAAVPEAPPAVRVQHLRYTYPPPRRRGGPPPRAALEDVSFEVDRGELFGVLGPNGGGKSTLFRLLSTVMPVAEAGRASVFGRDLATDPAAVRSLLGVVFQHPSLDIKLTAEENLAHQGRLYGLGGAVLRERIDAGLARFGLDGRRGERVERFSGGMRRRLELAKAMLHEPALLLMDEPATGLDPAARRELWDHLHQLRAERGVTVLLTTHLMEEADQCDRLAILSQGRLLTVASPSQLKARIGGEVVTVEPAAPERASELAGWIEQRLGPWAAGAGPVVLADGTVRFERPDGTAALAELTRQWDGELARVTVGRATLEDVFIHLTGSRFEGEPGG